MRLKELRLLRNLTQDELAKSLKIRRSTVAMWESGKSMPRSDKLQQLAEILGCSIDDLYRKDN